MNEIKKCVESELNRTLERIRRTGSGIGSEQSSAVVWEDPTIDEQMDAGRLNEDREMSFASRSLLIEKAHRLAGALERLDRGEYGICRECGEFIGLRRLRVMPEVTTCVRCQERLERMSRRPELSGSASRRRLAKLTRPNGSKPYHEGEAA